MKLMTLEISARSIFAAIFASLLSCSAPDATHALNKPPPGPFMTGCSVFDVPLQSSTEWTYAVRSRGKTQGVETIRVVRVEAGLAELSTSVALKEERIQWSTTLDCTSRKILSQGQPELAYALWPFPGIFPGQVIDESTATAFLFEVPPRRKGDAVRSVTLRYRQLPAQRGAPLRILRESHGGPTAEIDIDVAVGPLAVRIAPDSSLELIGREEGKRIDEELSLLEEEDEHGFSVNDRLATLSNSTAVPALATTGGVDYTNFCSPLDLSTYNGHWPELAMRFGDVGGVVTAPGTFLAGDDLTLLHDDRDSEFDFVPDASWGLASTLQLGQPSVPAEWESVMLFPKHPQWIWDNPDPNPGGPADYPAAANVFDRSNHFLSLRDVAYQVPKAGDAVVMRGAFVVDCGHAPKVEVHPPVAVAWSHTFGTPGIADYYFRASAYGWYPHVENFTGPYSSFGNLGAFEADLDIPDASTADPGSTAFVGQIVPVVDYTYAGYDISDDVHTFQVIDIFTAQFFYADIYTVQHPMAHLFGGDWSQPISTYFDVTVTQNGTKVHIHAMPKAPWSAATDHPQRPALIGFHFMACLPHHDPLTNVDLNGCVGNGAVDPASEYTGQAKPVELGGILNGWFYDRHRPNDPLTIEVRGYADSCDLRHTEILLGTVTTNPPNHTFSLQLPPGPIHICAPTSPGTPALEPLDGIVFRTKARDDRPEPASTDVFNYSLPGGTVWSPETASTGGLCPSGTGYSGTGYFSAGTGLVPFCQPGSSGQPSLPGTPVGVTAVAGANQVTLSWQPVSGAIGYNIYTVAGSVFTKVAFVFPTTWTLTGIASGSAQFYSIAAANSVGESPRSATVTGAALHCSQICAGCCAGEVCNGSSSANGCSVGGQACAAACPPLTDICSNGFCACHQSDASVCNPVTGQADTIRQCGNFPNACGGTVNCGTCAQGWSCTGGISAHCVCIPTTCAANGKNCGSIPDGCGGTLNCGACAGPQSCGGGGVANVCGCVPSTTCASAGYTCGTVGDGCGNALSCGSCSPGYQCPYGHCQPPTCPTGTRFCDPGCYKYCP